MSEQLMYIPSLEQEKNIQFFSKIKLSYVIRVYYKILKMISYSELNFSITS